MNTNVTKTWEITINSREVFARCTNESLYQAYVRSSENSRGDAVAIQDDDWDMFNMYFDNAIANLHMILARRMSELSFDKPNNEPNGVKFTLNMHDNHDNNILPVLILHCYDYVVKKVLEQWYKADFGSEAAKLEINHCLHYRKHPVRRRFSPLI